jgi:hypothetical protein
MMGAPERTEAGPGKRGQDWRTDWGNGAEVGPKALKRYARRESEI